MDTTAAERTTQSRALIDANAYMTLATADESGAPWASPVWFAHDAYAEFLWISREQTQHSRNIAARPQMAFVIFDSTAPLNEGTGVYFEATAERVPADAVPVALATFSERSLAQGGRPWSAGDVGPDAAFRLYRARVVAAYALDEHDGRVAVDLTAGS